MSQPSAAQLTGAAPVRAVPPTAAEAIIATPTAVAVVTDTLTAVTVLMVVSMATCKREAQPCTRYQVCGNGETVSGSAGWMLLLHR
jgi:hypothetical protein